MHLNLVDLALVALFALAVADGARRGLAPYLSELGAVAAGLALALALFQPAGRFLHRSLAFEPAVASFGAFVLLLAAGYALAQVFARRAAAFAAVWLEPRLPPRTYRATGAVPAFGVAALAAVVAVSVLAAAPSEGARNWVQGSALGSRIADSTGLVQGPLRILLAPAAAPSPAPHRILESDPASNPGEGAFYKLRFPADLSIEPDPAAEDAMLRWINAARQDGGLSPLRPDPVLQSAARDHSQDMYLRHYFSHQTPAGKTPYDRLHDLHFRYVTAGENIAFAPDAAQAWDSLMHSPDHRANILNPDFRCVGVGAFKGLGGYEEMFTQDFADCS